MRSSLEQSSSVAAQAHIPAKFVSRSRSHPHPTTPIDDDDDEESEEVVFPTISRSASGADPQPKTAKRGRAPFRIATIEDLRRAGIR